MFWPEESSPSNEAMAGAIESINTWCNLSTSHSVILYSASIDCRCEIILACLLRHFDVFSCHAHAFDYCLDRRLVSISHLPIPFPMVVHLFIVLVMLIHYY